MKRILWWLLAGTRGGATRVRIILFLRERPSNANQIAGALGLDYKTVRHHLDVLVDNRILENAGEGYGTPYFLTPKMEENSDVFNEIWDKIGKKQLKGGV
ncbi:MAG: winged helix-turn-helix domain-containing protein [Candidatus Hydrothermarchaeaceae archaeon]